VTAVNAAPEPDEVTRRMIDEAGAILAAEGLAALSLRKLAVAAGTSTMSVYTRFGSKEHLLSAMRREGFRRLGTALTAALAEPDPLVRLAEVGQAYRRAALDSPSLYGLMFGTLPPGLELSQEDEAAARATYETLVDGVRENVAAGLLAGDPDRIALHLWSVAHGMVALELAGMLAGTAEEAAQRYLEALALAAQPFWAGATR
jgi:AcrR family transcriptional regulator